MNTKLARYSAVGDDGKLSFVRKYAVGPADEIHYWTGMVGFG